MSFDEAHKANQDIEKFRLKAVANEILSVANYHQGIPSYKLKAKVILRNTATGEKIEASTDNKATFMIVAIEIQET